MTRVDNLPISEDQPAPDPQERPEPPQASGLVPPEQEVRDELHRILGSREFKTSKRCLQFLEYVVEQTLSGQSSALKERTIGVEVFERAASYDTNVEGIVRIKASEVRKRLALYYAGSGKESTIRIELPVGTYVPVFRRTGSATEPSGPIPILKVSSKPEPEPPIPAWKPLPFALRRWNLWIPVTAVLLLALAFWIWSTLRPRSVLEEFWAPVSGQERPVLIAAAYAPVYLSNVEGEPKTLQDIVLLKTHYVGGGDLVASAKVTGLLTRMGRSCEVRVGHGVTFEDLRENPSVLIGYSSTHWSEMTKDLRFYIDDTDQSMIRDRGKPTEWFPDMSPDFETNQDYAIIARATLPQTHAPMVLITGCTQYGTEAAANLVTNPELLAEALKDAPKGWQRMNLELVLQMKVIAHAPANPKVVATHYW